MVTDKTLTTARNLLKLGVDLGDGNGRTNALRASDGGALVALHNSDENDNETALGDLLADLMHWASESGVSWAEAERRALNHYNAERREELLNHAN